MYEINLFGDGHYALWCSWVMCDMLVKLVWSKSEFATSLNNYFLNMAIMDSSGDLAMFFMIRWFAGKLVNTKVVDNSCI
jgi:hypothetical protein